MPRAVRLLFWSCLSLAGLCFALYGFYWLLAAYGSNDVVGTLDYYDDYATTPFGEFIPFGISFVVCAWLTVRRKRIAPIVFLVTLALLVGWIIDVAPNFLELHSSYDDVRPLWQAVPGALQIVEVGVRWLYVAFGLVIVWFAYTKVANGSLAEWFRLDRSEAPSLGWRQVACAYIIAAFVWWILRSSNLFVILADSLYAENDGLYYFMTVARAINSYGPFLLASLTLVWKRDVRSVIDNAGARIVFTSTGWRVSAAPWRRITRVDLIERTPDPSGAVVHYRAKGWFPTSFIVNNDNGETGFLSQVGTLAETNNVRLTRQRVSSLLPDVAWLLISLAVLCFYYVNFRQNQDWVAYSKLEWPPADFARIASPLLYGATSLVFACLIGAAVGLLTAHHRAGTRPLLILLYVFGLCYWFPSAQLHWLLWIAIYSILMARTGQAGGESLLAPTWEQWRVGFFLDEYAVPISAVVYVITIVLVVRKQRVAAGLQPAQTLPDPSQRLAPTGIEIASV